MPTAGERLIVACLVSVVAVVAVVLVMNVIGQGHRAVLAASLAAGVAGGMAILRMSLATGEES